MLDIIRHQRQAKRARRRGDEKVAVFERHALAAQVCLDVAECLRDHRVDTDYPDRPSECIDCLVIGLRLCGARRAIVQLCQRDDRDGDHSRANVQHVLRIRLDGQPVGGFAYNKARALLAYLAVQAERPHQRDTLVGLLWPELPDTAARTNLRQALANLREAIGDATAMPPFLLIARDTIQVNPRSDYDLDVAAFIALLTAVRPTPIAI